MVLSRADLSSADTPIEHADLTEKTHELLRDGILSGKYAIGARLHVSELADHLGVSQTPVKMSLNRLVTEGLADALPRRGIFVARPSRRDVEESQEVRLLIELHSVAVGVLRVSVVQCAAMRADLDQYTTLIGGTRTGEWNAHVGAQVNAAFHGKIVEMCGNDKLVQIWRALQIQDQIARINALARTAEPERSHAEHLEILTAIEAGDVGQAQRDLRAHIERSATALATAVEALNQDAARSGRREASL